MRDAANGSILTEAVHSRTGSEVDVISGTDEARLSADAVRYGLNLEDGVVADLGGGSLELALIKKGEISQTASLPLGTVRLTARMDGEMSRMQGEIIKYVDTVSWLKKSHAQFLVPLGGAFRNFAQLNIAENRHPLNIIHGYTASPSVIQNRIDLLAGMSTRSLSTLSGIAARRRRSLPLTSVILAELMQRSAPSTIAFAAVGVREGYVFSLMSSKTIAAGLPLWRHIGRLYGLAHPFATAKEKSQDKASKIRLRPRRHGVARTPGLPRDLRVRALDSVSVSRDLTHRTRLYRALALLALRWQAPRRNRHGVQ